MFHKWHKLLRTTRYQPIQYYFVDMRLRYLYYPLEAIYKEGPFCQIEMEKILEEGFPMLRILSKIKKFV
jgi:hypothetical protein